MRDKRFRSMRWRGKGRSPGPGSTTKPICAPRSNDSGPGRTQHLHGNAFPTRNAHPTHRCGGDSRSWWNEIANWRPRIGNYARRSRSPSANSAPPQSSAAQTTRRERNRSQVSDPVDDHVGDTDHDVSVQVNATGNHRAEDNVGPVRRQQRLGAVRGDRPQPHTCGGGPGRRPQRTGTRGHPAPPHRQRGGPPVPTATPPDPAPTSPLARATSLDHPVAQHYWIQPTTTGLTYPPRRTRPNQGTPQDTLDSPAGPLRPHPKIKIKISPSDQPQAHRWIEAKPSAVADRLVAASGTVVEQSGSVLVSSAPM